MNLQQAKALYALQEAGHLITDNNSDEPLLLVRCDWDSDKANYSDAFSDNYIDTMTDEEGMTFATRDSDADVWPLDNIDMQFVQVWAPVNHNIQ